MAGLGVALSNPSLHPLFRDMKARWALENRGEQTDWIWVRNSESCRLHIHEYPTQSRLREKRPKGLVGQARGIGDEADRMIGTTKRKNFKLLLFGPIAFKLRDHIILDPACCA